MLYRQDIDGCFDRRIGEGGIADELFESYLARAWQASRNLAGALEEGGYPFLSVSRERDDLQAFDKALAPFRDGLEDVLFLGTGGSLLGGWTLQALSERTKSLQGGGLRLHFIHTIHPDVWANQLASLDLSKTGVIAISKSGGTAETLAQVLALIPRLKKASSRRLRDRMLFVTEPSNNPLHRLAQELDVPCLPHDPGIGGRFSVFSVVGALPALLAGVDMAAVRHGAESTLDDCLGASDPRDAMPVAGAALIAALTRERHIGQIVLMPYDERLSIFCHWYRQLWAESLGKDGQGTTPIRAMGPLDQHSQLQLYLDGPRDKFFTVVFVESEIKGLQIEERLAQKVGLDYLAGRCLNDLLAAEARATTESLEAKGRPCRRLDLDRFDGESLGALFMHFILETIISAELFGVNAFDQPAVEDSKQRARRYLLQNRC